jgi:hypothetical protein
MDSNMERELSFLPTVKYSRVSGRADKSMVKANSNSEGKSSRVSGGTASYKMLYRSEKTPKTYVIFIFCLFD